MGFDLRGRLSAPRMGDFCGVKSHQNRFPLGAGQSPVRFAALRGQAYGTSLLRRCAPALLAPVLGGTQGAPSEGVLANIHLFMIPSNIR